jgi:hypothetical protein
MPSTDHTWAAKAVDAMLKRIERLIARGVLL